MAQNGLLCGVRVVFFFLSHIVFTTSVFTMSPSYYPYITHSMPPLFFLLRLVPYIWYHARRPLNPYHESSYCTGLTCITPCHRCRLVLPCHIVLCRLVLLCLANDLYRAVWPCVNLCRVLSTCLCRGVPPNLPCSTSFSLGSRWIVPFRLELQCLDQVASGRVDSWVVWCLRPFVPCQFNFKLYRVVLNRKTRCVQGLGFWGLWFVIRH